jgi:hypothetical protein
LHCIKWLKLWLLHWLFLVHFVQIKLCSKVEWLPNILINLARR